jgi:taurine dioxygenase
VLYVNPLWTRRVIGVSGRESKWILEGLFDLSTATPEITYRHRWQAGDVVIWDMRSTLHRAIDDYGNQPRVLRRISVLNEPPVGVDGLASESLEGAWEW